LIYEKKLNSFSQIVREAGILDLDGGIRILGRYNAKKCFIFITKAGKGYALAIYDLKKEGKSLFPNKRLLVKELENYELKSFLKEVVNKLIIAYSY
jgi:hypothetical protein